MTFMASVNDQLLALERLANLCHGRFIFADEYDRAVAQGRDQLGDVLAAPEVVIAVGRDLALALAARVDAARSCMAVQVAERTIAYLRRRAWR